MREILNRSIKWSLTIAVITFVLAALFSITSNIVLTGVSWIIGLIVVLFIVLIGIFFDMLGIAATAADEVPLHAMASKKVYGAKHAIRIVKNADRFANFCNDVIGDISGIISGTASAIVILQLTITMQKKADSIFEFGLSVVITSLIAALTVGGKAFGKAFSIRYSSDIIFFVGKILHFIEEKFHIIIIKEKKRYKPRNNKIRK